MTIAATAMAVHKPPAASTAKTPLPPRAPRRARMIPPALEVAGLALRLVIARQRADVLAEPLRLGRGEVARQPHEDVEVVPQRVWEVHQPRPRRRGRADGVVVWRNDDGLASSGLRHAAGRGSRCLGVLVG